MLIVIETNGWDVRRKVYPNVNELSKESIESFMAMHNPDEELTGEDFAFSDDNSVAVYHCDGNSIHILKV